ncbi:pseudouridine synthase [Bdellovibrionota bacterium FG-1]
MSLRILFQDDSLVAVDKPSGFHVHPPEDQQNRISNHVNCLAILRDQIQTYLYPVHRIDVATSGVLVFALTPEAAKAISAQFQNREARKTYYCVVRGWVEDEGCFDAPLRSMKDEAKHLEANTRYRCIARVELPTAIGKYETARYSLIEANPLTGRYHQIRRHFARGSHPLLGDAVHGNGEHNRFFRIELKIPALMLKAQRLALKHPLTGEPLCLESRWTGKWHKVFDLFGVCPTRYC